MLVVGPNPLFMDYVAHVLPALGEEAVEQRAVTELLDGIVVEREEAPDVARLKADTRLAEVVRRAVELAPAREKLRMAVLRRFYERYGEKLDDLALRSFDELERALKQGGFLAKYLDRVLPLPRSDKVVAPAKTLVVVHARPLPAGVGS